MAETLPDSVREVTGISIYAWVVDVTAPTVTIRGPSATGGGGEARMVNAAFEVRFDWSEALLVSAFSESAVTLTDRDNGPPT